MANLALALVAALTLASSISLVATVVVVVPRIFRDHYGQELWRLTADLDRRARAGELPRDEVRQLIRAIDEHSAFVAHLTGSDVLSFRIAKRLTGQAPSRQGHEPFDEWESHPALGSYVRQLDRIVAKALMYGSFSGWLFTLYMKVKFRLSRHGDDPYSKHRAAEAGARRAVRRLEGVGRVVGA